MTTRFEVTTRTAVRLPSVAAQQAHETPTAVNRYDHAVTLIDQMRGGIRETTDRKGPQALTSSTDLWLKSHPGTTVLVAAPAAVLTISTGLITLDALAHSSPVVALTSGAIAALAGYCATFMVRGTRRVEKAKERHRNEKLDSADVERMLAAYVAAAPSDRAVLRDFVRAELCDLDPAMSPKAAETRDAALSLPAVTPEGDPQALRTRDLARAIRSLRDGGIDYLDASYVAIERVIDEAPAEERPLIADTLEKMLFSGEHATFEGTIAQHRRVYTAIKHARRGEPIAKGDSED